jgi:hypothetical protein
MTMQVHALRAERSFGAYDSARGDLLERRLQKFRPEIRGAVRTLARRHSRLADLTVSFPALLVALAVPRAGFNRASAIDLVIKGVPLAELAKATEVPLWMRRLAPRSFSGAIPKLPDTHDFRRKIVNHLPRTPELAPVWLHAVANAVVWCDEPFAVWMAAHVARRHKRAPHRREQEQLRLLCLWAWFSSRPETHARRFIGKPWVPSMQLAAAINAAIAWRTAVELYLELGEQQIADLWVQPGTFDGYEFVPLRSFAEVSEEARMMRNCVQSYGYSLVHNHSRLWSVRKDGKRVATLEVGPCGVDGLLRAYELRAAGNKDVAVDVAWAVRRWLHTHHLPIVDTKSLAWNAAPLDRAAWMALWKPYWIAKRRIPDWLPLSPSRGALEAL